MRVPFSFSVKLLQLTLALFILLVLIICVAFQVFLLADKKPIVRSQDLFRMACNYITEDTGLAQHNFEVKNLQRANFSRIAEPHAGLTNEANGLIHPRGDPPPKTKPTKGLNLHFWRFPFGSSTCVRKYVFLWFLCKHPFFPKYPSKTLRVNKSEVFWPGEEGFYQRLLGFVHPQVSGVYQFALSSDDSSELWLDWQDSRRIAHVGNTYNAVRTKRGELKKYQSQISQGIELVKGRAYYIEALHMQTTQENHLQIFWKPPGSGEFRVIQGEFLSPFLKSTAKMSDEWIPRSVSCDFDMQLETNPFLRERHLTYASHSLVHNALPPCQYKPSYVVNQKMHQYEGISRYLYLSQVYPDRAGKAEFIAKYDQGLGFAIPPEMDRKEAEYVVGSYMKALRHKYGDERFTLTSIKHVERKNGDKRGRRYLLNLELKDKLGNKVHLSEYVLQRRNVTGLCYPEGFQWKRDVPVNFVVTAKNQDVWIRAFIDNMVKIYQETGDSNIRVVILDYEGGDIHLKEALEKSGLPHYRLLSLAGPYSRTESFNAAMKAVDDPHSIVFLVDLHLELTSAILNDVRMHCVEGKIVYTPEIVRLNCARTASIPPTVQGLMGYWEFQGFGVVAMYKADWDRIGGFFVDEKRKYKWGGEDWELLDRIVENGLEFDRLRCPYVYHYFHKKTETWNQDDTNTTTATMG